MKASIVLLSIILASVILLYAQDKPNILVIWGDDIGYTNISINNQGMMGYKTPNIDRIGHEGAVFILGQHPFRKGLFTSISN